MPMAPCKQKYREDKRRNITKLLDFIDILNWNHKIHAIHEHSKTLMCRTFKNVMNGYQLNSHFNNKSFPILLFSLHWFQKDEGGKGNWRNTKRSITGWTESSTFALFKHRLLLLNLLNLLMYPANISFWNSHHYDMAKKICSVRL